jgi:hypothetical protein
MSKPVMKFDNGDTWARLWEEIQTCRNVAFVAKGQMPDHLHMRLDRASEEAQRILKDEVVVEHEETGIKSLFDKDGNVIIEDEPRGHVNMEEATRG